MFVDSHCHLTYPGLVEDSDAVVARAAAAGVGQMVTIATRRAEWDAVIAMAERHPAVVASIGVHPHDADAHIDVTADTLIARAAHPKVVAIGETGLDYHYDKSDRATQAVLFDRQIAVGRATGLPIVVHTRDAEDDTLRHLRAGVAAGGLSGVIHCFTASDRFADAALELGFYISFSGIVTFKNAEGLRATAARVPADRLLIETDAPFLAPVPYRGKTAEPAHVAETACVVAGVRGVTLETLAAETTENFRRLFRKAAKA